MKLEDLGKLERALLESLYADGRLRIGLDNALDIAQAFGTTTKELAAAKNSLRAAGYIEEQADVFTGGASVLTVTPAGQALFDAPSS